MVPVPFVGTGTTALHLKKGNMTETREQVVARVTAAVDGAADGAFGFDRPNPVTGAPLGLVAPGHAVDLLITDPGTLAVKHVWCAGRLVS